MRRYRCVSCRKFVTNRLWPPGEIRHWRTKPVLAAPAIRFVPWASKTARALKFCPTCMCRALWVLRGAGMVP